MTRIMKGSGIEWIGEIPEDWEVVQMRYLTKITTGNKDTVDSELDGKYPFFVRSKNIRKINSYSYDGEAILTAGDGDIGEIFHYIVGKFDFHQRVYLFYGFKRISGRLLYFNLKSNLRKHISFFNAKTTVDSLRLPWLKEFPIILPPLEKQKSISDFLDKKVLEIDNIIFKTKEVIKEYKKYKKTLITETVTKGLDKNVPMKYSGIEWIGDIPKHWEMIKLKRLFRILNGKEVNIERNKYDNNAIDVYGSGGVFKYTDEFLWDKPSILFGRKGTIGKPIIVKERFWTVDTMYYTEVLRGKLEFIYYMLIIFPWDLITTKTALPSITSMDLLNRYVPYPSLQEQKSIASYLDIKCTQIDNVILSKEKLLLEMESYKKSLIYEVVTGKMEVE